MEKAIVMVDMPEECEGCRLRVRYKYVTEVREDGYCTVGFFDKCILTNIDGYDLDWLEMKDDEGLDIVEPVNGRETCSCPLKPLPNKMSHSEIEDEHDYWEIEGYNKCLKEILGEDNE